METYLIHIKVPNYLKEWAMTAYQSDGNNYIEFPILGNENSVIRRFLQKSPCAKLTDIEVEEKNLFNENMENQLAASHKSRKEQDVDDMEKDMCNNPDQYIDILIPESKAKPPKQFNYLGPRGRAAVKEVIIDLFKHNLWSDLLDMPTLKKELRMKEATMISAWCELHGIDIDHEETVRQIFYRMRTAHAKKGVNLSSFERIKDKLT